MNWRPWRAKSVLHNYWHPVFYYIFYTVFFLVVPRSFILLCTVRSPPMSYTRSSGGLAFLVVFVNRFYTVVDLVFIYPFARELSCHHYRQSMCSWYSLSDERSDLAKLLKYYGQKRVGNFRFSLKILLFDCPKCLAELM